MTKSSLKKTLFLLVGTLLFAGGFVWQSSPSNAHGQHSDGCNELFTYEKTSDFDDSRVHINFESNDKQIDVSAQSGYSITKVWLDVDNDSHSGYFQYSSGALNNFNPNPGDDINKAKVEVKKVCASPSPSPSPSL